MTSKRDLIERLFVEHSVKLTGDDGGPAVDQTPAFEAVVVLAGGVQISGSLSLVPNPDYVESTSYLSEKYLGLKMLMPLQPNPKKPGAMCMPEMVFHWDDVLAVSVLRDVEVSTAPSPIIRLS